MAPISSIGFLGVDEISVDLAAALLRKGYLVRAFAFEGDGEFGTMERLVALGAMRCFSPIEVTKDVSALVLLLTRDQMDVIFGQDNIVKGLQKEVIIISRSIICPAFYDKLEKHLEEAEVTLVVDAYIFVTTSESSNGKIAISASGKQEAIAAAFPMLTAMSEDVYVFQGQTAAASKTRMVKELLEGIHLATSVEAMFLGVQAGIHPHILYDIISNAAGSSWQFVDFIPKLLKGDNSIRTHLLALTEKLGMIMNMAKLLKFPLPLLAVAHQLLVHGSYMKKDIEDIDPIKAWEILFSASIRESFMAKTFSPNQLAREIVDESTTVKKVGFIGLGAMGFGMATHLLTSNFHVCGFDVHKPTMSRFEEAGGMVGHSPADVSTEVDVLFVMVANEEQAADSLFGDNGSVSALPIDATIILSSTVSPGFVRQLENRLHEENKNLKLVDAPVSGGAKRAANGTLTIMASGSNEALKCGGSVLSALSENLYIIQGGCGAGSSVKMINQLLAGVHIAASAEGMSFGARMGLDARLLFEVIMNSEGCSWMFGNRVPHMLDNDYTPYSAVDIFVKDLGIVTSQSASLKVPVYISAIAHQQFISGSASGWGRLDDAAVVKVYETFTGVTVEAKPKVLLKNEMLRSLPKESSEDPTQRIRDLGKKNPRVLVVLDDDPTGTQTVHDIEVLTEWSIESLGDQFRKCPACFFILTNSRALNAEKASLLVKDICKNIDVAAKSAGDIQYTIVLRGDSTLRGHFPEEMDAAVTVLGEMDAWIICPFFLQGGRYTINDVHYVAESDKLIPAGGTEFAKDPAFGYKASNLCEWIEEKTKGKIHAKDVRSISLQLLREGGPTAIYEHLCSLPKGSTCIVNAASERDVEIFAAGMFQAEIEGKHFLCRTAASFVSASIGIKAKDPIRVDDLGTNSQRNGGLIVVGSYVPKTTQQVEELKSQLGHTIKCVEVSAMEVSVKSSSEREEEISHASKMVDAFLTAGKDTLLITSRNLIKGKTPLEGLEINSKVSSALVEIVKQIKARPRYILAKGGITSSDIATKALMAKRARVIGQALAGVPLWQLGQESRHPGVPYIVFPGNVGGATALAEVVQKWSHRIKHFSTKDILLDAEKGGYAVGSFNIYNLEGVEAVVAAAEVEKSPAILQVHPSSLKLGGLPLVACCISAAEKANVPIAVHFDHGTSEKELIEVLDLGFHSVMADGSQLSYTENLSYTKYISHLAHSRNMMVEAELGRLSGTEDDLTVEDYEARFTDPSKAEEFVDETKIDALAVCIGNVHGSYPASGPNLRLDLLKNLHTLMSRKGVFLVLHGASGLSKELIQECISLGVRKFNVNTEVRKAYVESLRKPQKDLVQIMESAKEAMKAVVAEKMRLFGSSGKA